MKTEVDIDKDEAVKLIALLMWGHDITVEEIRDTRWWEDAQT